MEWENRRKVSVLPSLVRFAFIVNLKGGLSLEPSGTLGTIVPAEAGKVLSGLGLLEKLQVTGRREIGLCLVDVPESKSIRGHMC
jgi:hypothetical protein